MTLNVQVPGDAPPNGLLNVTGTQTGILVRHLDLAGTATDDFGVNRVLVTVRENDSGRYVQPNGTLSALYAALPATLATPNGTSTTWTLPVDLPINGDYSVTAFAYDTADQQDTSTSGATARYLVFPGDALPYLVDGLGQPINGAAFTEARIVVSGRAQDDTGMADVQIGIVDSLGRYMSSSGTFTSTSASYRSAFLTSPGSLGSNFSYTTPVIPNGTYTVLVRAVDVHDQVQAVPSSVTVTVTQPAGNLPPVPHATVSCVNNNVCTFDGRTSTDENAPTLTYSWNFGNGRTGSGPLPTQYYTGPGTFTPTLTVRDEYGLSACSRCRRSPSPSRRTTWHPRRSSTCRPATCWPATSARWARSDPNDSDTVTLPVELRRRYGDQHVHVAGAHVPRRRHLHGHADGDRRLGQVHHGDEVGDGLGRLTCRRWPRPVPLGAGRGQRTASCLTSAADSAWS